MKRCGIILVIISLFLSPAFVFAYHVLNDPDGNSFVFNIWSDIPVNFRIDGGTLNGGDGVEIFLDACDEWNDISDVINICGDFQQIDQDITEDNYDTIVSFSDGLVDVVFDETGAILNSLGLPSTVLGVGIIVVNSAGSIVDGVLILNGSRPSGPNADILATAVHEMGHIWGLAHTPIGAITANGVDTSSFGLDPIRPMAIPTMYPFTNPVDDAFQRTIEQDDQAVMKIVYPD